MVLQQVVRLKESSRHLHSQGTFVAQGTSTQIQQSPQTTSYRSRTAQVCIMSGRLYSASAPKRQKYDDYDNNTLPVDNSKHGKVGNHHNGLRLGDHLEQKRLQPREDVPVILSVGKLSTQREQAGKGAK